MSRIYQKEYIHDRKRKKIKLKYSYLEEDDQKLRNRRETGNLNSPKKNVKKMKKTLKQSRSVKRGGANVRAGHADDIRQEADG